MISLDSVTVAFGRTIALDDVTLDVHEGITGLFGQNGSGKSTLLRVLCGLLRPTNGSVEILGRRASARDEDLKRHIGYVGHDSGLYPMLSVEENLALFARLYGAPEKRCREVLDALGIGGWARTPSRELSAGMRRRAAVARALVHDPAVLLLDEPYANLDDDAAALLSAAIVSWRRSDRVCIVATHGAKKVKAYADAGVILQRGRVQSAGIYRRAENVPAP
jgi:heme exporter protein A